MCFSNETKSGWWLLTSWIRFLLKLKQAIPLEFQDMNFIPHKILGRYLSSTWILRGIISPLRTQPDFLWLYIKVLLILDLIWRSSPYCYVVSLFALDYDLLYFLKDITLMLIYLLVAQIGVHQRVKYKSFVSCGSMGVGFAKAIASCVGKWCDFALSLDSTSSNLYKL